MKKKNLLSIGELSKITGVHIKALRYYDRLGILTPAYVDPDSGYRYYSFCQKAVVDAIQFCVDLDIPLKHFHDYTNETEPWICYKDLVDRGTVLVEEKIRIMEERLDLLKAMQSEMERSEVSYRNEYPAKFNLPERTCWLAPYEGALGCDESNEQMKRLIMEIYEHGLQLGNANGLLLLREGGEWKQYIFVDVNTAAAGTPSYPELLHIPAGQYLCKKAEQSGIGQVWDWSRPYASEAEIALAIETELFVGNYAFSRPVLEQRCLLKTDNAK
ncbi:MAG: MerR family DNA-binding transcriptional regulator [Eubacteriales bacterium]|nr:MerR family DNA-binding transcriptional regulator [Eubacteriales bacterium]